MTVPQAVIAAWRTAAEQNEARRQSRHESRQDVDHRIHLAPRWEDCWNCQRQAAVCRSKLSHDSMEEALARCADAYLDGVALVPYRCEWAEGLHWHAKTPKTNSDIKRARRIARRHATANPAPVETA